MPPHFYSKVKGFPVQCISQQTLFIFSVSTGASLQLRLRHKSLLRTPILHRKKDGDWYIYPWFLVHENLNNVHKNVQKSYKIFKPRLHNVLSTGTNIVNIWLSLCLIGCVRFARYCGKMYSRHLFSYGGLYMFVLTNCATTHYFQQPDSERSYCTCRLTGLEINFFVREPTGD